METLTGARKAGYILGIVLGLGNAVSFFFPSGTNDDGDAVGPPVPVLVVGIIIGLVVMGLLWWSWRADVGWAKRVAVVLLVVLALLAVPAFGQDSVAAWVKSVAGVVILATIVDVVLLFLPQRTDAPSAAV